MISLTIEMPIPAELLSFRFKEAQNATIEYCMTESVPVPQVKSISVAPSVLREINNTAELTRQCEASARHNAKVYWMMRCGEALKAIEKNGQEFLSLINN